MRLNEERRKIFAERLIEWWSKGGNRDFPWRRTRDPYKILVAEALLRKTTAKQAEKLYEKFLERFPAPEALARASPDELGTHLTPLGMEHKRAKTLIEMGRVLVEKYGGRVPSTPEEIASLPGAGRYAANAVLCLAYGRDAPMVDTNVVRVVQRVFGFKSLRARPRDDPKLWEFVGLLIPPGKGREFNLAVLDFAATVCTAKAPHCSLCLLTEICDYFQKLKAKEKHG